VPVPLPGPDTVNLEPPDAAETQAMAEGVASAVAGRDGLRPVQRRLVEALFPAMTGHPVTLPERPSMSPTELAGALARRDLAFRTRGVQAMLLCALVLRPLPDDVAESVAAYAAELGVADGMVDVARELAAGSLDLAAQDFIRNGYEGTWHEEDSVTSVHSSRVLHEAWDFSTHDPELVARWAALEHLPSNSLGRKVWEMYEARGFAYPGLPRSAPPLLTQHDWVHVLADYGTTVESEVEVFAFIERANDDPHAFSLLAMVISLFETGYLAHGAGLFDASPGHFSSDPRMALRLADALSRGARCRDVETGAESIDFLRMDWFAIAERSCEDLRRRFSIGPKSAEAVEAGSVGPWEPGGISPFQMDTGRQLAAARGVPYDAHGADVG
jgi:hypothetical protein